ncbi:MAG: S8 family peptidase [Rhodospirillaceae bacterium]
MISKKPLIAAVAAALAFTALPALAQDAAADLARAQGGPEFIPDEVLVKFRPGTAAADKAAARGRANAVGAEVITTPLMRELGEGDIELVRLPAGMTVANAMARLKGHFAVEYAEPNWIYRHDATSNDPYYTNGSLWGMSGGFGSGAATAWGNNKTNCSSVYVGIIDEGYMYTHEDLAANAGVNPGETAGNGVDDDGNGYVDDVYGWDFDGNNSSVFDGAGDDHGTHVAGTIGAVGGNGKGVAGVCWSVKLLSGKFLGNRGGTTDNAIRAVDYFTDLKIRHGIKLVATNNSWGGGGFSQALMDAIERANSAGILFVAAAGNGGRDGVGDDNDKTPHYPSSYTNANIIAVASITSTGARSSFSNYGKVSVDIGAPGSGIYSTLPKSSKGQILSSYGSYSGTSMATPHVTGAVALYAAQNPNATAAQIKSAILDQGTATPSMNGATTSGKRLNVGGF